MTGAQKQTRANAGVRENQSLTASSRSAARMPWVVSAPVFAFGIPSKTRR